MHYIARLFVFGFLSAVLLGFVQPKPPLSGTTLRAARCARAAASAASLI
jgi:hypothetical protein